MAAAISESIPAAEPRTGPKCPGEGFASDDDGERSDSSRSDSTRVPSVACLENPRARWADLLSDDDEPGELPGLRPALQQPAPVGAPEAQGGTPACEKKVKRQRPKVWREKAAAGGHTSSSKWSSGTGDDNRWSSGSPSSWDAYWSDWWGPAEQHATDYRSARSWTVRDELYPAGAGKWGRTRGSGLGSKKLQCQFFIGIDEEPKFHVRGRVLGPRGQFVKDIAERTGAKLRLRGRGSSFKEGPEQQESADPLMLCVSAPEGDAYEEAKALTRELLEGVYADYRSFYAKAGLPLLTLRVKLHEGPREGAF